MPTVADTKSTPQSGISYIDALLDNGPGWNLITPYTNTIMYTFSIATGNETGETGQAAFSASQMSNARLAMAYISSVTGINFVETGDGTAAQVHLCNIDIAGASTSGLCSWGTTYNFLQSSQALTSYSANAYVYLDNVEWKTQNANLTAGGQGYETLLHELGHMLGLKHPFDTSTGSTTTLPTSQDNTSNTLMSYTESGGPYSTFRPYDIAALNWLYGGDGLVGALGIGSTSGGRYYTGLDGVQTLTGGSADDALEGKGGNDILDGGSGTDTAIYSGLHTAYTVLSVAGVTTISGADGTDTLISIEKLRFSDGTFLLSAFLDVTAPAAPTQVLSVPSSGYVKGNTVALSGTAEASSTVKILNGATTIGTATANASGAWSLTTAALADGNYSVTATATDAAGNTSNASTAIVFKVDATAPATPTQTVTKDGTGLVAGNQPLISGAGEAGATISLVEGVSIIGQATVAGNGTWSLTPNALADGKYNIVATQADAAGNVSGNSSVLSFTVASTLNKLGTSGADILVAFAGNNNLNGGAGTDTAVFSGNAANYTVLRTTNGYTVADKVGTGGTDLLVNVERIQFGDKAVAIDIDGHGGQAYRIYQAAFDRVPDLAGVGFWMLQLDSGATLQQVATAFLGSKEFTDKYGVNVSDSAYVTALYANVLHRAPDQAGFDYWVNALGHGGVRNDLLVQFSESTENVANVIGVINNGFTYIPFV